VEVFDANEGLAEKPSVPAPVRELAAPPTPFPDRRQQIFRLLWVNRRRWHWVPRIDALNMIDVEFFGDKGVQNAWQDLRAHYLSGKTDALPVRFVGGPPASTAQSLETSRAADATKPNS
jgi:hypothetical protein